MKKRPAPLLVAIVGGSGAGKSWLADRLQSILGTKSARISLDDFYRDRPGLTPARRANSGCVGNTRVTSTACSSLPPGGAAGTGAGAAGCGVAAGAGITSLLLSKLAGSAETVSAVMIGSAAGGRGIAWL